MNGGLGYHSFESPRRPTPHSTHGSLSTPIRNVTTQQQPSPSGRPTNQPPLPSTSNHGNPNNNNNNSSSSKVWVCQNCYTRNVKALQRCALCDCIDPASITLTTPDVATVFGSGSSPPAASSSSSSPPYRYHGGSASTDHSVYVGATSVAALSTTTATGRPSSSQYLSPRRFSPPSPLTGTSSLSSYPPHSSFRQQPPSSLLPATNSLQSSSGSRGAVGELGYPPAHAGPPLRRGDLLPPSTTTTYLLSPSRPGAATSARGLAATPPSPAAPVVVAAAEEPVSMTTTTTTNKVDRLEQQQPQLTASPPQRQESAAVPPQEEVAKKKDERSGSTDRNEAVEWKTIAEDLQDEVVLSRARADATQRCHLAEREVMEMELRRLREELLARDRSLSTHATPTRRSREAEHGASMSNSPQGQMHYHTSAGRGRRTSQDSSISNHNNHNISSSHHNETTKEREAEEEQRDEGVLIEDGSPPKGERERTIPAPVVLAAASDEMLPSVEDLDDDGQNNNHNNNNTEAGGEIVSSLQFELEEKNSQIIDLRSEVEILREAQRKHVAQVRQWQEQSERQTQLIAELQQEKADLRVAALFHSTSPALTVGENPKTEEKIEEEEKADPKDEEIAALQKKLDALNNELADVELERERGEQRLRRELLYLGNDFTALKEEHEKLLKRQEQEQEEHSGEGQGSKAAAAGGGTTEHEEHSRPASSTVPQDHTGSDYGMSVTATEREQFEKLVVEGRHRQEELQSALTASTAEVTELREEVDLLRVQLADAQVALTLALRELDQPPRQR